MTIADWLTLAACSLGVFFFIAGTAGILRFPDAYSRLHALTKADNLGLGLIALGLAPQLPDGWSIAKLALVWLLAVLAAATVAQLAARAGLRLEGRVAHGSEAAVSDREARGQRG